MNVLIIGGTGVLSSAVVAEALKIGLDVTMINRGNRIERIPKQAHLIKSDRNNLKYIKQKLANSHFDAVVDFLCTSESDTLKSLQFYSHYANHYVYISSAAVINTSIGGIYNEESSKVQSLWDYSLDKWKSEQIVIKEACKCGVDYTIIRPCVTYDNTRIPYGISPTYGYHWTLVSRVLNNKPIITWNNGTNRCNMMRVEDFAVAFVGLLGNKGAINEAINICGEECPSFIDVIKSIEKEIGHKAITIDIDKEFYAKHAPRKRGEILGGRSIDAIHSVDKLKRILPDYRQTIFLDEGIQKTINSYRKNNYQKGIDWVFDAECDRVIARWLKYNKIDKKGYNIDYVDYLGDATVDERRTYFLERNKDVFPVNIYLFLKYIVWRLSHVPGKIYKIYNQ